MPEPEASDVIRPSRTRQRAARERAIGALAARQHGVVTRSQLVAMGIEPGSIDRRLEAWRLRRLHRGVYLVGHTPVSMLAREMAAVLACQPHAVLSHRGAAHRWQLLRYRAGDQAVDVTVLARQPRSRPGIRVHRVRALGRDEVTLLHGIPVTTPARTLLDLAAQVVPGELEQAVAQAERRHLASRTKLLGLIARYPRRTGTRALRALLDGNGRPALTRSEAERLLLGLVRRANLPQPDTNVRLSDYEVDLLWREHGLVVEVDGFDFHSSRAQFEADRRRDAKLAARGIQVVRVTWRQVVDEPEAVLVRLAQVLANRARR